jgi:enoyl-CoA hydratase/carnithine racemase
MSFETLRFAVDGAVARVTLHRPHVLNAFDIAMRDELFEVLRAVRDDRELRVLVIDGAGRAFCAGADLTEFGGAPSPTAGRRIRFARDVWALLASLELPRIAAVHGYALGTGLELALLCDLRIAAEDAVLGLPEAQLGLIPAAGATQTLARVAGVATTLSLTLTGRRLDAREALRLGVVSEVVPAPSLRDRTDALVRELAARGSRACCGRLGRAVSSRSPRACGSRPGSPRG